MKKKRATFLSRSQESTHHKAAEIAQKLQKIRGKAHVLCLQGDLGSGKTTFTKGFGAFFGVDPAKIQSPTYTFVKEHPLKKGGKLYHFDLYRVEEIDDVMREDILEILQQKNAWVVIEWPERLGDLLAENGVQFTEITLEYVDENTRNITVRFPEAP